MLLFGLAFRPSLLLLPFSSFVESLKNLKKKQQLQYLNIPKYLKIYLTTASATAAATASSSCSSN